MILTDLNHQSPEDQYLGGITYAMRMKVAAALSADGVTGADAEAAAAEVMAEAEAEEAEEAAEPVAKKGKKRALDSLG